MTEQSFIQFGRSCANYTSLISECTKLLFERFLIQLSEAEHSLVPITQIHLQQLEKVKFWIIKTWTTEVYSIVKNLKVFKCMCLNQEMY